MAADRTLVCPVLMLTVSEAAKTAATSTRTSASPRASAVAALVDTTRAIAVPHALRHRRPVVPTISVPSSHLPTAHLPLIHWYDGMSTDPARGEEKISSNSYKCRYRLLLPGMFGKSQHKEHVGTYWPNERQTGPSAGMTCLPVEGGCPVQRVHSDQGPPCLRRERGLQPQDLIDVARNALRTPEQQGAEESILSLGDDDRCHD